MIWVHLMTMLGGGLLTFNFDAPVLLGILGFLDFDDRDRGEGYIRAYTNADDTEAAITFRMSQDGTLLNPEHPGNNSMWEFDFGDLEYSRLEVEYPGSGALSYLEYTHQVAPNGSAYWLEDPESMWW